MGGSHAGGNVSIVLSDDIAVKTRPKSKLTLQGSIRSLASLRVLLEGKPGGVHCGSANWMCLSRGVSLETACCQAFASGKCGNLWNLLRTVYKLELDFID